MTGGCTDHVPYNDYELPEEIAVDPAKAKPNRFVASLPTGGKMVLLDPDVAAAFPDADAVNDALRTLLRVKSRSTG